jgi:hypothetical protein
MIWLVGVALTIWWACEKIDVITRRQAVIVVVLEIACVCGAGLEAAFTRNRQGECTNDCTALTALDRPTCAWMCR